MAENPTQIESFEQLEQTLEDKELVLLDFYADWCGPCKMMEPVIEDISEESEADVAKIDVDKNQDIASEFGVQGIPTFALVVNGEIEESFTGAKPQEFIEDLISEHV